MAMAMTAFALTTAQPSAAAPPEATMIGRRFDDGLDSRLSSQEVSRALNSLGYSSVAHAGGHSAADAWSDGLSTAVFGAFGHGNAGIVQTDEGPTDEEDEILAAGDLLDISAGNLWFWGNYLHYIDVDDMRLAIFAGCYTANTDPEWGSFGTVAEERGVDSVVGFSDLVYFPAECADCNYSGNYFWSRFSTYASQGDTVGTALSKSRADLVAKEGDAAGWDKWRLHGALDRPGDVRLAPAASGTAWNSRPYGIDPFDLVALEATSRQANTVEGREVVDVGTTEGVGYRVDNDTGQLLWLSAPTSLRGEESLSDDEVERRALDFARSNVPGFEPFSGAITRTRPSREEGDAVSGVRWRVTLPSGLGPEIIEVEVDRRTGAVVYFSAARGAGVATEIGVDGTHAVATAKRALNDGAAEVVSVVSETWERPTWTVTLDRTGQRRTPDFVRVHVDARSGQVLAKTST